MFSYLSRGYGTWEGIAKLETPDSAISPNRGNYVLPPIKSINKDKYHVYDQQFEHDPLLYKIPQEEFKLPEMPKNSLHIPKTYTTKSGALLLYSEGCFVPGSRRLKRRQRFKRREGRKVQTLKDLMELIMDYKKNGCDPLLLEQLWQRMSSSARDVQPGYSPKRYLSHLSHTTFDPDSWKKLVETGSLKSFGTTDDGFLPPLLADHEYDDELRHRPQPYKTMSLPPVSPSSSMLGSFTFYKHALSTGAASMVSLPSVNSDTLDEQLSGKTAGTFVESLAERLAEVESESGFKRGYDTLTDKEKGEVLTQLLMDVTLHSQRDIVTIPPQTMADSTTVHTDISYLSDAKSFKSLESIKSSVENSDTSRKSDERPKSVDSSKYLRSVPSRATSVCSLPPIVSKENTPDSAALRDAENGNKKATTSMSSSHSGLGLVVDDFAVGLNGIDFEIEDGSFYLAGDTGVGLDRKDSEARSLQSEKTFSEQSLIDALDIQDAESLHQLTEETISLKSLGSSDRVVHRTGRNGERLGDGVLVGESTIVDGDLMNDMVHGADGTVGGDYGSHGEGSDDDVYGSGVGSVDDGGSNVDGGSGGDGARSSGGLYGHSYGYSGSEGDGHNIGIVDDTKDTSGDVYPGDHESTKQTMPTIDVVTELQTPHISLSSLQNEVRLVAQEVLSRPKSGRILAEDAEMATLLLMERMEGLLGPALTPEDVRVSSAAPKKVRPLGQPRNSEVETKRRIRSAEATLASRIPVKPEENHPEQLSSEKPEPHVEVEDDSFNKAYDNVAVDDGSWNKIDDNELSVDDVIVIVDTVEETGGESLEVASTTLLPESEVVIVKDLPVEQVQEEIKPHVPSEKKRKESVQKEAKVKKVANTKRGSVAKGKKKKTSIARARNEPPKTPPFRAGLVPESKPPKGLDLKSGGARKKGNDKQASPDLQDKTELKTKATVKSPATANDVSPPGSPVRVDSETGEVEHTVSPPRSEKSPSLAGSKSPADEKVSVSHEDEVSVQTDSPSEKSLSLREKTPSPRDQTPSPRDKTPSPRDKTPSPRDKTPSPSEQKACPRDRDAVLRENINSDVVTESVEPAEREPSPEVVLTEKQRRANARAAQRAAAAERRRLDVERKRREREEARKRAQEEEARLEVLRQEAEVEMKRREEKRRIEKEQEERERMSQEAEQNEHERQERLMIERQRQAREDWKRKKEQLMAQRKFEEELRMERERVEQEVEEERRREYEEKIAHLEEEERERLMEERRLDEERIKREIEEEKERREEERRRMLQERRKMEEELAAARERQLERRTFLETLLRDFQNLLLDQRITRAFTFSYLDILPWFKDRWKDLDKDRPSSKRPSTPLDTVPEEPENDLEQIVEG